MPLKDKAARSRYAKARYLFNRDRERANRRTYYLKTRDKFIKRSRERYARKKIEVLEYQRNYSKANSERIREYSRAYRLANADKLRESAGRRLERRRVVKREWDKKNAEHVRAYRRGYLKRAYELFKGNLRHQLAHRVRARFRVALTKRTRTVKIRVRKISSSIALLGCTMEQAVQYIESKFSPGMSWKNWSVHGWHLDHVLPLSSFDLTNHDDLARACHYTNLQPLWAIDNIRKGGVR